MKSLSSVHKLLRSDYSILFVLLIVTLTVTQITEAGHDVDGHHTITTECMAKNHIITEKNTLVDPKLDTSAFVMSLPSGEWYYQVVLGEGWTHTYLEESTPFTLESDSSIAFSYNCPMSHVVCTV